MISTDHIIQRQSQRSIPKAIVSLVYLYGDYISDKELYLSKKNSLVIKSEIINQIRLMKGKEKSENLNKREPFFFGLENTNRSRMDEKRASYDLNKILKNIDRYIGVKLIADGEIAITCYRCGKKQLKKISMKRREKFVH